MVRALIRRTNLALDHLRANCVGCKGRKLVPCGCDNPSLCEGCRLRGLWRKCAVCGGSGKQDGLREDLKQIGASVFKVLCLCAMLTLVVRDCRRRDAVPTNRAEALSACV